MWVSRTDLSNAIYCSVTQRHVIARMTERAWRDFHTLSGGAAMSLINGGYFTAEDVAALLDAALRPLWGMGPKRLAEVRALIPYQELTRTTP